MNNSKEKVSMSFGSLVDNMIGRQEDDEYVFFLDIVGTSEQLMSSWNDEDFLLKGNIALRQTHFIRILALLAKEFPQVSVRQLSDCAILHSKDLRAVVTFAVATFKHITIYGDKFSGWAIRGGGGKGLRHFVSTAEFDKEVAAMGNFSYSSVLGKGNVESADLEKKGPRGMRLFITDEVANDLRNQSFKLRAVKTRNGDSCYEINWMSKDPLVQGYFRETLKGQAMRDILLKWSSMLALSQDQRINEFALSIGDLVAWTEQS